MKIPYGIADFYHLRSRGQVYVDRTHHIQTLEELGETLLFLRPRRFGKSLWLSTLAEYYDLRRANEHEMLFSDLAIGHRPTELAHRYFVLRWDFSKINPDPTPPRGDTVAGSRTLRLGREISAYLSSTLEVFQRDYREHLPEILELGDEPFRDLERILSVIRRTPYRLYLLIDEYDNFANEIIANDQSTYRELVHSDGPFKYLFKWVKGLLAGAGLERLFMAGVSPMVMSDVTSGLNIAKNIYLAPELAALCGFTDEEVASLLDRLHGEAASNGEATWEIDEAHAMIRDWYNGYRFAPAPASPPVYNPTLVLYFLDHLGRYGEYPRQMLDSNLAADEGKLDYLAQVASGRDTVIDVIRGEQSLEVDLLLDRFTLGDLLERSAQDVSFWGAYLYYFGMLTLAGESPRRTWLLEPPNEVVRGLYLDRIRRMLLPLGPDRTASMKPAWDLMEGKEIEPFLDFIEKTLFPTFSNRDATWANELTIKTIFLSLLWNGTSYVTHSEPELDHGYADLCLIRRPDARGSSLWDLLFELKRLPLGILGKRSEELKAVSREELASLPPVQKAFEEAEHQLGLYGAALERRYGDTLKLRSFAVVALGFDRLVARSASR